MSEEQNSPAAGAGSFLHTLIDTLRTNTEALTRLDGNIQELRSALNHNLTTLGQDTQDELTALQEEITHEIENIQHSLGTIHSDLEHRNTLERARQQAEAESKKKEEFRARVASLLTSKPMILIYSLAGYVLLTALAQVLGLDLSPLARLLGLN